MSCMCGDLYCGSCGPMQGNGKCYRCGAWALDGGCANPEACERANAEQAEQERLMEEEYQADYRENA